LLQAGAKQTRSGDTQQRFNQEQITYISRPVNRAIDDYCMSNNSVIGTETKSHIFNAVESAIKQTLDLNCAHTSIGHFLQS
ncbi:T3SS effector protein Map, partial [Escherichia coli]